MAVKRVTLTVDAYEALRSIKEEGESFSDVVRRLTEVRVRLSDFAGAWGSASAVTLEEVEGFLVKSDRLSARKLRRRVRRALPVPPG
jgi:predicted CopG family antitoxin